MKSTRGADCDSPWALAAYLADPCRVLSVTIVPSGNSNTAIFWPSRAFSFAIACNCLANGSLSVAHFRARYTNPNSDAAQPIKGILRRDDLSEMYRDAE